MSVFEKKSSFLSLRSSKLNRWLFFFFGSSKQKILNYERQIQVKGIFNKLPFVFCWIGQNVHSFFPVSWLQQRLVVFNFIQNDFVRLYCDSCHISVHLKFDKIKKGKWSIFYDEFLTKFQKISFVSPVIDIGRARGGDPHLGKSQS